MLFSDKKDLSKITKNSRIPASSNWILRCDRNYVNKTRVPVSPRISIIKGSHLLEKMLKIQSQCQDIQGQIHRFTSFFTFSLLVSKTCWQCLTLLDFIYFVKKITVAFEVVLKVNFPVWIFSMNVLPIQSDFVINEIQHPFSVHGFRLLEFQNFQFQSFFSLIESFFNGACLSRMWLNVLRDMSKGPSMFPISISRI